MGGVAKTIVGPIARGAADVMTFGTNELVGNPAGNIANRLVGQQGGPGAGSFIGPAMFNSANPPSTSVPGPFTLDPNQVAGDTAAINSLGASQYKQTLDTLTGSDTTPGSLASLMKASLPQTTEDLNAQHVLNSTALPQAVATQEANLAANYGLPALTQEQSFGQAALGRQFSLEDFINQANVAKTIGAQAAPQVSTGKGQSGTSLSGVGALAPLVTAFRGPGKLAAAAPAAASTAGPVAALLQGAPALTAFA